MKGHTSSLKKGGKPEYLVDRMFGIEPHDRVSADVVINVLEEATSQYLDAKADLCT